MCRYIFYFSLVAPTPTEAPANPEASSATPAASTTPTPPPPSTTSS